MGENIMWKQHGCEWSHVCFLTHCMKIKCESMRWWMFVQQSVSNTSMWTFPWKLCARDVFNFTWTFTEFYAFRDQFVWPWPNVKMTGASEKEKGFAELLATSSFVCLFRENYVDTLSHYKMSAVTKADQFGRFRSLQKYYGGCFS